MHLMHNMKKSSMECYTVAVQAQLSSLQSISGSLQITHGMSLVYHCTEYQTFNIRYNYKHLHPKILEYIIQHDMCVLIGWSLPPCHLEDVFI